MKIHIVKEGDTLYLLSQKYDIPLQTLIDANPQIVNPSLLMIGDKIKIPASAVPVDGHDNTVIYKHVVKQGDTLWKLSKAWGVSLQAVINANPQLKNPNVLLVGEVVNIPSGGHEHAPSNDGITHTGGKKNTAPKPTAPMPHKPEQTAPITPAPHPAPPAIPIPVMPTLPEVHTPAPEIHYEIQYSEITIEKPPVNNYIVEHTAPIVKDPCGCSEVNPMPNQMMPHHEAPYYDHPNANLSPAQYHPSANMPSSMANSQYPGVSNHPYPDWGHQPEVSPESYAPAPFHPYAPVTNQAPFANQAPITNVSPWHAVPNAPMVSPYHEQPCGCGPMLSDVHIQPYPSPVNAPMPYPNVSPANIGPNMWMPPHQVSPASTHDMKYPMGPAIQPVAQAPIYPNAPYPNAPYPNAPYPNAPYPNAPYPNAPYPNNAFYRPETYFWNQSAYDNSLQNEAGEGYYRDPMIDANYFATQQAGQFNTSLDQNNEEKAKVSAEPSENKSVKTSSKPNTRSKKNVKAKSSNRNPWISR